MSSLVFEHYQETISTEAMEKFRTHRTHNVIDDILDQDFSLVFEAFDDIDTLLAYSDTISNNANLSMEDFGFISSHLNSIESKYKGIIDFNTVVSESMGPTHRATLVSEAMSGGAMALVAGVIAAVIGIITWLLGKNNSKATPTAAAKASIEKSVAAIENNVTKEQSAIDEIVSNSDDAITANTPVSEMIEKTSTQIEEVKKLSKEDTVLNKMISLEEKLTELRNSQKENSTFKIKNSFLSYYSPGGKDTINKKDIRSAYNSLVGQMNAVEDFRNQLKDLVVTASVLFANNVESKLKEIDSMQDQEKAKAKLAEIGSEIEGKESPLAKAVADKYNSISGQKIGPLFGSEIKLTPVKIKDIFCGTYLEIDKISGDASSGSKEIAIIYDDSDFKQTAKDIIKFKNSPKNYLVAAEKAASQEDNPAEKLKNTMQDVHDSISKEKDAKVSLTFIKNLAKVILGYFKLRAVVDGRFSNVTADMYKLVEQYQKYNTEVAVTLNNIRKEIIKSNKSLHGANKRASNMK